MATAQSSTQVLRFPALPTRLTWKRVTVKRAFAGHTLYRLGVLITLLWVGVALLAPWIAPYSPTQGDAALAQGSPSLPTCAALTSTDATSSRGSSTVVGMTSVLP